MLINCRVMYGKCLGRVISYDGNNRFTLQMDDGRKVYTHRDRFKVLS